MTTKKTHYLTWIIILLFSLIYLTHDVLLHPAISTTTLSCPDQQLLNADGENSSYLLNSSIDYSCPFCSGFLDSHSSISIEENTTRNEPLSIIEDSQHNELIPGIKASRAPPIV